MNRLMIPAAFLAALLVAATLPLGTVRAGGGGHCRGIETTVSEGTKVVATEGSSCFMPTVLHIEAGQTVEFDIGSALLHTVTGANVSWGSVEASKPLVSYTFDEPGVYPYYCIYHAGMAGAIVVGEAMGSDSAASLDSANDDTAPTALTASTDSSGLPGGASWFGFGVIAAVVAGGGVLASVRLRGGKRA